jgi:putative hydrolase of the HAD superfamily
MPIRAVLFDAAGTLIELKQPVGESYAAFARRAGVTLPAWRLQDAFERILRGAPARVFPGRSGAEVPDLEREWWRDRVRETFRAADSTVHFRDFDGFFEPLYGHFGSAVAWTLRPGARAGLSGLRESGHALGIASNFDHRLPKILEELEVNQFFSSLTIPAGCGSAKPDAALFAAALKELGSSPGETLYLGDEPDAELAGARVVGICAVPVSALENLADLPARLDSLATLHASRRD